MTADFTQLKVKTFWIAAMCCNRRGGKLLKKRDPRGKLRIVQCEHEHRTRAAASRCADRLEAGGHGKGLAAYWDACEIMLVPRRKR